MCDVCFATKKSSHQEFFVPAGTHLGVRLLKNPCPSLNHLIMGDGVVRALQGARAYP